MQLPKYITIHISERGQKFQNLEVENQKKIVSDCLKIFFREICYFRDTVFECHCGAICQIIRESD